MALLCPPPPPTSPQTMIRVKNPEPTLQYYREKLGLVLLCTRHFSEAAFSLYFLCTYGTKVGLGGGHGWIRVGRFASLPVSPSLFRALRTPANSGTSETPLPWRVLELASSCCCRYPIVGCGVLIVVWGPSPSGGLLRCLVVRRCVTLCDDV